MILAPDILISLSTLVVLFAARRFLVAQLTDGEQRDAGPSLAVVATPVSE